MDDVQTNKRISGRGRHATLPHLPVVFGLPETEAAVAMGISPTKFRQMVDVGSIPKPRIVGGKLVYDVDELREAFKSMPHQGEVSESDTWADVLPASQ